MANFVYEVPMIGKIILAIFAATIVLDSLKKTRIFFKSFTIVQDALTWMMFGLKENGQKAHFFELIDCNMNRREVLMSSFKGSTLCIANIPSH